MTEDREAPYILSRNKLYCKYCPGYCCYRLKGSTLYLDATDINRIARFFCITDGEVRKKYIEGKNTIMVKKDGSCIFLSDKKMRARCSIHTARPLQCQQFPYEKPCPYLEREDLLSIIQPKVAKSLTSGV
jgi:Fe-S-cluster containining protein